MPPIGRRPPLITKGLDRLGMCSWRNDAMLVLNDPPTARLCEKSIKFLSKKNRASHLTCSAFFGLALRILIPLFFNSRTILGLFTQPLRWGYSGAPSRLSVCRWDLNKSPTCVVGISAAVGRGLLPNQLVSHQHASTHTTLRHYHGTAVVDKDETRSS